MKEIVLYYFESCPYCQKVLRFMGEKGLTIKLKDTHRDPGAREELVRIGGKAQVPCLVIEGKAMYESSDIIQWLDSHLV